MSSTTPSFVGSATPLLPRARYRSGVSNHRNRIRSPSFPSTARPAQHVRMTETSESPSVALPSFLDTPPVVIGAGPAGAFVASLLSTHNIPVTLLERRSDAASFNITKSYFMQLDTRGKNALSKVPTLLDIIASDACEGNGFQIKSLRKNGQLKTIATIMRTGKKTPDYMVMRASLAECLGNYVKTVDSIDAQFGVNTEALEFLDDGMVQVTYTTANGEKKAIRTRCVIACDGRNSFAAKQVDQRAQEHPEAYVTSNGIGDIEHVSASHNVGAKSIVLDASFVEGLRSRTEPNSHSAIPPFVITRFQGSNNMHMKRPFNMFLFPNPPNAIPKVGGFLATVALLPGNPICEVDDIEKAYELFQANFPSLDVRKVISESSMRKFISTKVPLFGKTRRRTSLTCRSPDGNAGVIFVGDAAHSFPPDIGLGINTALEDAVVFVDALIASSPSSSVGDVMRIYEKERENEITALIELHRKCLSQYQYRAGVMNKLLLANNLVRTTLSSLLPGVIAPPVGVLVRDEKSISEALRKLDLTSQRLTIMATVIIVGVMAIVFVS